MTWSMIFSFILCVFSLLHRFPIAFLSGKFIAHAARVESPSQAMSVRDQLLSSKKYASATHNIWVYRIRQPDGIVKNKKNSLIFHHFSCVSYCSFLHEDLFSLVSPFFFFLYRIYQRYMKHRMTTESLELLWNCCIFCKLPTLRISWWLSHVGMVWIKDLSFLHLLIFVSLLAEFFGNLLLE